MTDLIRRSVLIDEICRSSIYKWSVEEDQAAHNWALNIINSQPSVESSKGDLISRADAIKAVASITMSIHLSDVICDKLLALPSADAEQVTGKLKNPCDSLLADDSAECKEQKSKLEHDREWIIGCIKHDGFIKTDRFDKANQIILDALSAEAETKCIAQIKVDTEEIVRRIKEEYDITDRWIPCSERLPERDELVLVTYKTTDKIHLCKYIDDGSENPWWSYIDDCCAYNNVVIAWMPLPTPYKGGDDE